MRKSRTGCVEMQTDGDYLCTKEDLARARSLWTEHHPCIHMIDAIPRDQFLSSDDVRIRVHRVREVPEYSSPTVAAHDSAQSTEQTHAAGCNIDSVVYLNESYVPDSGLQTWVSTDGAGYTSRCLYLAMPAGRQQLRWVKQDQTDENADVTISETQLHPIHSTADASHDSLDCSMSFDSATEDMIHAC